MTKEHVLKTFQEAGVRFLTTRGAALLADDQGLGKTVQTISACKENGDHRILVFTLPGMVSTWVDEIAIWDSEAEAVVLTGATTKKRQTLVAEFQAANPTRRYFITNWHTLTVKKPLPLANLPWSTVVADEAHAIGNRKAKRSVALKKVTNVGKNKIRKIALTGTPYDKHAAEMWSILNWLSPKRWNSYWRFVSDYMVVSNRPWGTEIVGVSPVRNKVLQKDIAPWVLRRTKPEVQPELPRKTYQYIWCDISRLQYKLYRQLTDDFMATYNGELVTMIGDMLPRMTKFREVIISPAVLDPSLPDQSPRLDAVVDFVMSTDEPLIIVSTFRATGRLLKKRLADNKKTKHIPVRLYDGGIPIDERDDVKNWFQTLPDGKQGIICGTIETMHLGLTLTRATTMYFVDRDWTRRKNVQMEDRINRITAGDKSHYVFFGIRDTVDQRVNEVVSDKSMEFRKVFVADLIGLPPKPGELNIV